MADYGEWNRKGGTLTDVTAQKEYGVTRDFIVQGIRAGKLEHRDASMWGNPSMKILRGQLELYIATELGAEYLARTKCATELRSVNSEIVAIRRKLVALDARRAELERILKTQPQP